MDDISIGQFRSIIGNKIILLLFASLLISFHANK